METKSSGIAIKASDTGAGGSFVGYASTWTRTPDSYGDVVAKGAFKRTLGEWKSKGRPIPVLWSHKMDDAFASIGTVTDAVEDDHGLKVTCDLDLENPTAAQVHRLLKRGSVAEMSFAFSIADSANVTLGDGSKARELRDMDLYEVSVVPLGANSDTSIDEVKAFADVADAAAQTTVTTEKAVAPLTDEEITSLRALLASDSAPEEGEADDNAGDDAEAASGGNAKSRAEAVARITNEIRSL